MEVETEIKVEYTTTLGDSFEDDETEETKEKLIEEHIKDYCEEHNLNRNDVKRLN